MGSVGSYKFPEHSIDAAFEMIRAIDEESISKQELLAEELGHSSPKSGAFRNKLTSLRRYGLINKRGDITLTKLARDALHPGPGESREEFLGKAVLNVSLFKNLYEENDYNRPSDKFWYTIYELAEIDKREARDKADQIASLYESGLKYVKELRNTERTSEKTDRLQRRDRKTYKDEVDKSSQGGNLPEGAVLQVVDDSGTYNVKDSMDLTVAEAVFEKAKKKLESGNSDHSA